MINKNITKASKNALREYKSLEEERNHNRLVLSFNRLLNNAPELMKKGTRLTVSSVAKEAGLSRGTVYLHHDILVKINSFKADPKSSDYQRKKAIKNAEIAKVVATKSILEQLQKDKHFLAQENYRLTLELKDVNEKVVALRKQIMTSKVISMK